MLELPKSPDAASMTAEIVAASSAPLADGYSLVIAGDLSNIEGLDRPLPVLLDHQTTTAAIVGWVAGFRAEAAPDGTLLLAQVQVQADHPEAARIWSLIEAGAVRWSIRFEVLESHSDPAGDVVVVDRWRALEVSAVAVGADPAAVTRSRTDADIRAAVSRARLPQTLADELIRSGASVDQARARILDTLADMEAPTVTQISAPIRPRDPLAEAVARAFDGNSSTPLWLSLRDAGFRGRSGPEVIARAMHSTSDFPALLQASGDRLLQQRFAAPARGVLQAASLRQLADYRPAQSIAAALAGEAQPISEGAEVKFTTINESLASYKPRRVGLGLSVSPEALANDDLGGLRQGLDELGDACLAAEAAALVELLEGHADGALAPDGARLFAAAHNNATDATLAGGGLTAIGEAIALLRTQRSIGGRALDQEPELLLVAPAQELLARQLLADLVAPASRDAINPWAGLIQVAVDARLSGAFCYLIARGQRPLELGRLTPAPVLTQEIQFTTGALRSKVEHAFGCGVLTPAPIVRIPSAA
jgi:hypothetical protein